MMVLLFRGSFAARSGTYRVRVGAGHPPIFEKNNIRKLYFLEPLFILTMTIVSWIDPPLG